MLGRRAISPRVCLSLAKSWNPLGVLDTGLGLDRSRDMNLAVESRCQMIHLEKGGGDIGHEARVNLFLAKGFFHSW